MESRLVLVEREDKTKNTVLGCSGVMINNKYVITTANLLLEKTKKPIFHELKSCKLNPRLFSNFDTCLNVIWTDDEDLYIVKKAYIFSPFISENIKNSSKYLFRNWAIDSIDNNRNLNDILSLFFVLTFDVVHDVCDFKNILKDWWYLVGNFEVNQGDAVYIRSNAFGNRNFMNSYSKGIISNVFGLNFCLFLSDCPSTPGSEGSPLYASSKRNDLEVPIGLVLSSLSWWKGEWIGLTLAVDIRSIIMELIDIPIRTLNFSKRLDNPKIVAATQFSLVQIYCGNNWGTAILLDEKKGIFITNAHVIEGTKVKLHHKNGSWNAILIYRTPENCVFDLALIKSETNVIKKHRLKSIHYYLKQHKIGDCVYSAGFSLFPKDCAPSPTLTKGCISHNNPYMLKTTCCVHPGASGGAILDVDGALVGIIVCNTKLHDNNVVYPRVNMAVPYSAVAAIISNFIESEDVSLLENLNIKNTKAVVLWKRLQGKL